jgi:hypothetical protein
MLAVSPAGYLSIVEYRPPTRIYAFVLAVVSGVLLARGHLVGGGIAGVIALVLLALWKFANARGDDDRFTIW